MLALPALPCRRYAEPCAHDHVCYACGVSREAKGDRDGWRAGLEKTHHKVPGGTHTVLVSLPSPDKQCPLTRGQRLSITRFQVTGHQSSHRDRARGIWSHHIHSQEQRARNARVFAVHLTFSFIPPRE